MYRITDWVKYRSMIKFAERQLKKHGLIEGKDYAYEQRGKDWAIYAKNAEV